MKWTHRIFALIVMLVNIPLPVRSQDTSVIRERLQMIRAVLDSQLFVNRFESIETPCLYIDRADHTVARPRRDTINSDYRLTLRNKNSIDPSGVKCLNQYCARYLKLRTTAINYTEKTISGTLHASYAYPAGSLIQYLGFANDSADRTNTYFTFLLQSAGTFVLYPENDKYRIKLVLKEAPYQDEDCLLGYLEIVQEAFVQRPAASYTFYFDQMSLRKGDTNNQIFLKFSSTTHYEELKYYSVLAFHVLRYNTPSDDDRKRAQALWLDNFLRNPACAACIPVYRPAMEMVRRGVTFLLPNTGPIPSH